MNTRPLEPSELKFFYFDTGDGGIGVTAKHIPTGSEVTEQATPYAHINKQVAIDLLTEQVMVLENRSAPTAAQHWLITLTVVVVGYDITLPCYVEAVDADQACERAVMRQATTAAQYQRHDWTYETDESRAYKVSKVVNLTADQATALQSLNF